MRGDGFDLWRSVPAPGKDIHLHLLFAGANPEGEWQSLEPHPGSTTYMIGKRPENWIHEVPHFGRIVRRNLYPGVDLVFYGADGNPEYDLILHPGADPRAIRLRFSGQDELTVRNGDLIAAVGSGRLIQHRPRLYQLAPDGKREDIAGEWQLVGHHDATFTVGPHDTERALVIDPILVAGTFIGGSNDERIVAADARYGVVGTTTSADFPASQSYTHAKSDIFLFNPVTQYTLILGGSGDDIATCARISSGGVLVGGYTNSRDFPTTAASQGYYTPAVQAQYGGGDWDGFVFSGSLSSSPSLSTYIGGSGDDRVLAIDNSSYGPVVVGSTTSTDFPLQSAWQSTPGGGTDGFLSVIGSRALLTFSTYLGGSGDDRALAVSVAPSGQDIYIAGSTASGDWQTPGSWTGSRSGSTDGFLLHAVVDPVSTAVQPAQGIFFGGSGDDRIAALTILPNGSVAAAGTTSSPDLAFPAASQSAFGGGASDGFLAQFSADLQTLLQGTYIGGSGTEEAVAIATNSFSELLVGGWTNSPDFPVVGTALSTCGNGAADGFLAHMDSAGKPISSTCYGGSGSDHITSVLTDGLLNIYLGGDSDSADLPVVPTGGSASAGGVDGFLATLVAPVIHADSVTGGKDLSALLMVTLGDPANYVGTPVTATSGDPTKVLVGTSPDDPGQASSTLASAYNNNSTATTYVTRRFFVYCLTDNGTVPLTVAAPGYPDRAVTVRCVPSGLYVNPAPIALQSSGTGSFSVLPAAFDPATGNVLAFQAPRAGLTPIDVTVAGNTNSAVTVSPLAVTIDPYTSLTPASSSNAGAFSLKATGAVDADLTFATSSTFLFVPSNTAHIHSDKAVLTLYIPTAARDLMIPIQAGVGTGDSTTSVAVTLTTSDPSRILLHATGSDTGQSSITVSTSGGTARGWIEVLDAASTVTITASAPGYTSTTTRVPVSALQVGLFTDTNSTVQVQQDQIQQGGTHTYYVRSYVYPYDYSATYSLPTYTLRAAAKPIQVQVTSSAPYVASAQPPDILGIPFPSPALVTVQGNSPGSASISAKVVSGSATSSAPTALTVNPNGLYLKASAVGYDLQGPVNVFLGGKSDTTPIDVKISVSDPRLALLSTDSKTIGQASLTISQSYSSGQVLLQSLASSGWVVVTASADGYGSTSVTVPLVPSGFAWYQQPITVSQSSSATASFIAYALNPASLAPTGSQQLRPGLTGSLTAQAVDSTIVTLSPSSIDLSSLPSSGTFNLKPGSSGKTQLTIVQPPGFTQPAGLGSLQVTVLPVAIGLNAAPISRNAQAQLTYSVPGVTGSSTAPAVTITSSDPSKLLLATDAFSLGSGSVTVTPANQYNTAIYMNAIDGPADVQVTASSPGLASTTITVPIGSTALGFNPSTSYSYSYLGSTLTVSSQQSSVPISLSTVAVNSNSGVMGNVTLRPGLDPVPVTINASNASLVTVLTKPILNSLTSSAPFTAKPLAPGETDLTLVPPPGFVLAPPGNGRTLHLTINGPSFVIQNFTLGQDLETPVYVGIQNGSSSIPNDVDVTFTSSDSTKLLLSADATTAGTPALTLHLLRGSSPSFAIYPQALDQSGQVSITISAPGYASTSTVVTLAPTTFACNGCSISGSFQTSPVQLQLGLVISSTQGSGYGNYTFRPGVNPVVGATVLDSGIATVTPASLVWPSGAATLTFQLREVSPGTTSLKFSVPAPYTAPAPLTIAIAGATLNLATSYLYLGNNLQDSIGVNLGQASAQVTVTSSDPSRVRVSAAPTAVGTASASLTTKSGQYLMAYVQGIADAGSVKLTFTAPGYQDSTATVQLVPSAVELATSNLGIMTPLSAPATLQARLVAVGSYSSSNPTLRPGMSPVVVQTSLSTPGVASVTPAQLTFNPGDSSVSFTLQPTGAGSTLLALSVPTGFSDPLALRQQLITVVPVRISLSGTSIVGKDLALNSSLTLAAPVGSATTITLTSSDPSRLLLANAANPAGAASLPLTIGAGASGSAAFSLIGLAATGTVSLTATAPGVSSTVTVSLAPSGFVLTPSSALIGTNTTGSATVLLYALDPITMSPTAISPLRPGAAPVSVTLTSSNVSVVPNPSAVVFSPGDTSHSVTFATAGAGTAVLTLKTPNGFTTSSSVTETITVH